MAYQIEELRKKIQEIRKNGLTDAIMQDVNSNPDKLLDYQRYQLFEQKVGSDGKIFGVYKNSYNRRLVPYFGETKNRGDRYTLRWTDEFFRTLFVKAQKTKLVISSYSSTLIKMEKNPNIVNKNFFGLFDDNWLQFSKEQVKPFVNKWILNKILT